jgi:hypothetical protein
MSNYRRHSPPVSLGGRVQQKALHLSCMARNEIQRSKKEYASKYNLFILTTFRDGRWDNMYVKATIIKYKILQLFQ